MDKLAVILPVYAKDKVEYVKLAVDSVCSQQYDGEILILIGVDGPVGKELKKCLVDYDEMHNVEVVWFEENRGLACVLNDLLEICFKRGYDFIARMDADDCSLPQRIEKQMAFLKENPEIDVVGGAIEEMDEDDKSRGKTIVYPQIPEACREFFSRRNPHAHPAVLFRTRFFDKIGHAYRPEYRQNQDTMLWYDGFMAGTKNANIPDVVLKFRMTNSLFKKRRNGWAFAMKQLTDRKQINKDLHYGVGATLFAYAMFCMLVSPAWVKKIAYKVFR